jgi:hypothetical protein
MVYILLYEGEKSFNFLDDLFSKLKTDKVESSILKEGVLPQSLQGIGFFNFKKEKLIGDWKHVVENIGYFLFPQNTSINEVAQDLKYGYIPYSSSLFATCSYAEKSKPVRSGFFGALGIGDVVDYKTLRKHGEISFLVDNHDFVNVRNISKEKYFYLIHKESVDFLENVYFKDKKVAL